MERYDPVALEKAPRQLTVSAIYTEMKEGRGPVYWHVDKELLERDPSMSQRFGGRRKIKLGIEFQRLLGGVRINERAETGLPHLYSAGESSGGVHGADRMQGTSFLETQIFGARAGYHAATLALRTGDADIDMRQVEEETARIKGIKGNIRPSPITRKNSEIDVGRRRDHPECRQFIEGIGDSLPAEERTDSKAFGEEYLLSRGVFEHALNRGNDHPRSTQERREPREPPA